MSLSLISLHLTAGGRSNDAVFGDKHVVVVGDARRHHSLATALAHTASKVRDRDIFKLTMISLVSWSLVNSCMNTRGARAEARIPRRTHAQRDEERDEQPVAVQRNCEIGHAAVLGLRAPTP